MPQLPVAQGLASRTLQLLRADLYICDVADHDEGPLTQHLRWWVRVLSAGELPGKTNHLLALLRQSTTSLVIVVAVIVQMIYDASVTGSMFGLRIALALYTTLVVIVIFKFRRRGIKTHMAATARRCAKLVRFYEAYAWLTEVTVFVALIVHWQDSAAAGLELLIGTHHQVATTILLWASLALRLYSGVSAVLADYTSVVLILVIYLSMANMYEAIGEALQTRPCNTLLAHQQSVLTQASLNMEASVADLLSQVLIVSVVVPLLSTVEVVLNGLEADMFAVGMAPLVLFVFVPFCLVGDAMTYARLRFADRAGAGPWLEETVQIRKMRLGMVQLSQGHGGDLRGWGIGHLDRKACGSALKSWFQFLQVLMNLQ
ncbi:Odorant receptor 71 [Frankliniella occidentalis]|nr:Odorant receptor 71 [Frankliniella occidentalis]